jgi:hypothetical protein
MRQSSSLKGRRRIVKRLSDLEQETVQTGKRTVNWALYTEVSHTRYGALDAGNVYRRRNPPTAYFVNAQLWRGVE